MVSTEGGRSGRVREASVGYGVTEVTSSDLKNDWHRWLHRVADGGQVVIVTRYGTPIAKLCPMEADTGPPRVFGALAGTVSALDDLTAPSDESWDAES